MEYVFGTVQKNGVEVECLKTVGKEHSDLEGRVFVHREYTDRHIDDSFTVVEKYDSKEDVEEKCYDWYIIEGHSRDTDMFSPVKEEIQNNLDGAQDALCGLSADVEDRISELEDALCELSMNN